MKTMGSDEDIYIYLVAYYGRRVSGSRLLIRVPVSVGDVVKGIIE